MAEFLKHIGAKTGISIKLSFSLSPGRGEQTGLVLKSRTPVFAEISCPVDFSGNGAWGSLDSFCDFCLPKFLGEAAADLFSFSVRQTDIFSRHTDVIISVALDSRD